MRATSVHMMATNSTLEPPRSAHQAAIAPGDHKAYMQYALERARLAPHLPTNFCVGAVLVDADKNRILSTGYTRELASGGDNPADPGNTHAEQCCFLKIAAAHGLPADRIGEILPSNTVLYTTMEPCNKRSAGNKPCVQRILPLSGVVSTVYVGVTEPETFVGENVGRKLLEDAGISVVHVDGMQDRILEVATAGHTTPKNQ